MNENERSGGQRGLQPSRVAGLMVGLVIVAVGLVLLLDQEGIVRAWDVWRFWPVILIAVGVVRVVRGADSLDKLWGLAEVAFGVVFLLGALGYPHFSFSHTWPLVVVGAGLWVLAQRHEGRGRSRSRCWGPALDANLDLNRIDVFGGGKVRVTSRNFRRGKWVAVFGGSEIDFRNADMEGSEAVLELLAVFGGGELIVPRNWEVQVHGVAFLGGHNDETERPFPDSGPRKILIIKGAWVLGGFNVKN